MHVNKSDSLFLKKFSMVIGFLVLLALCLILFAHHLNKLLPHEQTPQAKAQTEARIAPVGAVYAGRDGVAQQLAAAEALKASASSNAAYGGTMDGKASPVQIQTASVSMTGAANRITAVLMMMPSCMGPLLLCEAASLRSMSLASEAPV